MDDNDDYSAVDFDGAGAPATVRRAPVPARGTGKKPDFLLYAQWAGDYVKVGAAWRIEANAKGKAGFSIRIDDKSSNLVKGGVLYMWPNEAPSNEETAATVKHAPAPSAPRAVVNDHPGPATFARNLFRRMARKLEVFR